VAEKLFQICAVSGFYGAQNELLVDVSGQLNGSVFKGHTVPEKLLNLRDGTDRLSRNVGKKLALCDA